MELSVDFLPLMYFLVLDLLPIKRALNYLWYPDWDCLVKGLYKTLGLQSMLWGFKSGMKMI